MSNAKHYEWFFVNIFQRKVVKDIHCSVLKDQTFKLAAKSGVDVVIITPHIWDKRLVHFTTQSYYRELIEAGVKIFEYTPGFIHSKIFVSDDSVATVGTTNMDFRSLYLHFECGAVIYDKNTIADIKDDFLETLKESQQISIEQCKKSFPVRLIQNIVRLFAPLM